tara:strand:+ start:813 stop:1166 length:354 start_codon:yes stop_codon:yes gene_type:complete
MPQLIPFDPKRHKPIELPGGRRATEYLASEGSPEGKAWNIPQIWFDSETGDPKFLQGDRAWDAAKSYEDSTGLKFPRFETLGAAVEAAKSRSKAGGSSKQSLAIKPKTKTLLNLKEK